MLASLVISLGTVIVLFVVFIAGYLIGESKGSDKKENLEELVRESINKRIESEQVKVRLKMEDSKPNENNQETHYNQSYGNPEVINWIEKNLKAEKGES